MLGGQLGMSFWNRGSLRLLFSCLGAAGSALLCPASPALAAPATFVVHSDAVTGITSDAEVFVSLRYMRHLWITPDGVQVAVIQQGSNGGLGLYKSFDAGSAWSWEQDLPGSSEDISDGIMLADGSLLLVTSIATTGPIADVEFIRMNYDALAREWSLDPLAPSTVYGSSEVGKATRATIAMDSNGVLWSAFRLQNANTGNVRIRLFSSVDDGLTWQDSLNLFGTANAWVEKNGKVVATGTGIAVVLQDVTGSVASPVRWKAWAHRDDAAPLQAAMTSQPIAAMRVAEGDPHGSHFSVAADSLGNLHLSYQDGRIFYARLDESAQSWSTPVSLGTQTASYNSISVAGTDDLYVFTRFAGGTNLWVKRLPQATQQWSGWLQVSASSEPGLLRMCSPERVDDELPVLYQVNAPPPGLELLHALLDV